MEIIFELLFIIGPLIYGYVVSKEAQNMTERILGIFLCLVGVLFLCGFLVVNFF